ncbi:unnamed protein product [Lampetra planeri]
MGKVETVRTVRTAGSEQAEGTEQRHRGWVAGHVDPSPVHQHSGFEPRLRIPLGLYLCNSVACKSARLVWPYARSLLSLLSACIRLRDGGARRVTPRCGRVIALWEQDPRSREINGGAGKTHEADGYKSPAALMPTAATAQGFTVLPH